jgi:hypothetical protein
MEWIKQDEEDPDEPTGKPASVSALLAGLRGAEPAAALQDLSLWLESARDAADAAPEARSRSEDLALVQEAGAAHVAALQAQYLAHAGGTQAAREAAWKALIHYQSRLTQALYVSAEALMRTVRKDASLLPAGAAITARALRACREFAKTCLMHYSSVPRQLWRAAYSLHARAEKSGCAANPVNVHADHKTVTTVEQELLRLLLLQAGAPDMMAPEQIEVADRVAEQLAGDFTLRPPGVADNPFCFDPAGDAAPQRAIGPQAQPGPAPRYFGPGVGYDALERIHKQLAAAKIEDIKVFGKDLRPRTQLSTVQHLLAFWGAKSPYSPPVRSRAAGTLQVIHGFGQIWTRLSGAQAGAGGLTLAAAYEGASQAPETWTLLDAGGKELGAELPPARSAWTKCGDLVGVAVNGGGDCWAGVIRRMHADSSLHADIAILSREPRAVSLRVVLGEDEDSVYSEAASRQFATGSLHAIILSDGVDKSQPPNLLLPPESWKEGRIYEVQAGEATLRLRGLQAVRRGDDFVRATFEWVSGPEA